MDEADADRVADFSGLQALAVRAMVESGEAFAQLIPTEGGLRVRAALSLLRSRETGSLT